MSIQSEIDRINQAKTDLAAAIESKGVTVPPNTTINVYPGLVQQIEQGAGLPSGGTPGQLLTKTATGEEWADAPRGLPEGGTEGQILYRGANGAEWGEKPVMYVNITGSGAGFSADKTAQEIYEAVQKGFVVFAKLLGDQTIPLFQYTNDSSMFYKVTFDGGVLISISGSAVEIQ